MRTRQLLASGSIVVLASVGLAPASSAQDHIGLPPDAGSDEVEPGRGPGSAEGGDYVGVPGDPERADYVGLPGDPEGDDYVGLPPPSGDGGEYVGVAWAGAAWAGPAARLSPPLIDLRGPGSGDEWGPAARIRPPEEGGRSVDGLPASASDVVLLGGLVTVGLALAVRRARGPN